MSPEVFAAVLEATWPPARVWQLGPFTLRDGAGGGKRVSAASVAGAWSHADLVAAEAAMAEPLFMIRAGDTALDAALQARGYAMLDPTVGYAAPVADLVGDLPVLATFAHWPPLQIVRELWSEGGIGAPRVAVMERVAGAHCALLARDGDRAAGVAFVAQAGSEAMVHALEVQPLHRRQGVAGHLMRAAANWAAAGGATRLSLAVTRRNDAACALYDRAGMQAVGQYHYRIGQQ